MELGLDWFVVLFIGFLQGVLEWLPVSSEGNISLVLSLFGFDPLYAVHMSLFLHMGTGFAALVYYRDEIYRILLSIREMDVFDPFSRETSLFSFLFVAVFVSGFVGISVFLFLEEVVSEVATWLFIVLIGVLLVFTGLLQRFSGDVSFGGRKNPRPIDALFLGFGQGLALLPGVSRSGTTVSIFLLRGYSEERAFVLSFILAVPASFGASLLALVEGDILLSPLLGFLALLSSMVFGFATIELLMSIVQSVSFWKICILFGLLMIVSSILFIGI